jgi:hypothetical protein
MRALALGDMHRTQVGAVMPSIAITSNRWIRMMVVGNRMAEVEPHTPRTAGAFFQSTPQSAPSAPKKKGGVVFQYE